MPENDDLKFARAETIALLRRMADLIEQAGNHGNWHATLREIERLRSRAAELRLELEHART